MATRNRRIILDFFNLIFEKQGKIAKVTINRPEVRNALNYQTWTEIEHVLEMVEQDDEIGILIFTGAGEKAFIAGADIVDLKKRSMVETINSKNLSVLNRLASSRVITIAAINGFALGGGCELAMACDLRIAEENAKLGQPELNLGFLPGAGGTQRLTRLVGPAKAKELILTGKIIDAQEAMRIGLVNFTVGPGEAVQEAEKLAGSILSKGPLAVRLCKIVVDRGADTDLVSGLVMENLAQTAIFGSEDRQEGIDAFLEKRKPKFAGR
jgi:enoyl-CoA hydratase